jgi:soluble lytic murein transglycosylase-like protein
LALALPVAGRTADALSPSDQYLALRHTYAPVPGLTPRLLAESPNQYAGKTLEISGRLTGVVKTAEGAMLILTTDADGPLTMNMTETPTWVQAGTQLRVLAVAAADPADGSSVTVGIPDLKVVAVASASDIAAAEAAWQAQAAQRAARDHRDQAVFRAANRALNAPAPLRTTRRNEAAERRIETAGLASRGDAVRTGAFRDYLSPAAQRIYPTYVGFVHRWNRRLSDRDADAIASSILAYSERYSVDPRLVVSLIIAESDFHPSETSNKGAMGLGQLMPDEVRSLGLTNPYDPIQNIGGAVYLLRGRLDKYSGGADLTMNHIILALASYNAGMGAVKKYGGVPPYRETQNYVRKIERIYTELCAGDSRG